MYVTWGRGGGGGGERTTEGWTTEGWIDDGWMKEEMTSISPIIKNDFLIFHKIYFLKLLNYLKE